MGMLASPIDKIKAVRFEPFPSKRVLKSVAKLTCVNGNVYAQGENGTIYTTGELAGKVHYCGTGSDYHAVKALVAFGLITAKEAHEHGEEKRKRDNAYAEYRALFCACDDFEKAGIKLTAGQKAKLAKMKKALDPKDLPYFLQGEAAKKLGLKE